MSWEEEFRRNIERTRQRIMEIAPDMLDLKAHHSAAGRPPQRTGAQSTRGAGSCISTAEPSFIARFRTTSDQNGLQKEFAGATQAISADSLSFRSSLGSSLDGHRSPRRGAHSPTTDFLDSNLRMERIYETEGRLAGNEVVQCSLSPHQSTLFYDRYMIPSLLLGRSHQPAMQSLSAGTSTRMPGDGYDPEGKPKPKPKPKPNPLFSDRSCAAPSVVPTIRYSFGTCPQRGVSAAEIFEAHTAAYVVIRAAWTTLQYMHSHPDVRILLWNWGNGSSQPFGPHSELWNTLWQHRHNAEFAGLWYWFGDDPDGAKFGAIRQVFYWLIRWFEEGGVNEVSGNHDWNRKPVIYWCSDATHCGARHPHQRYIELCEAFRTQTLRHRIGALVHESFHNVGGTGIPRDVYKPSVCFGVGDPALGKCYADFDDLGRDPWIFGENPVTHTRRGNNPRNLIVAYEDDLALKNVDNYVSWVLRRWEDPQFGPCDAPRLHGMDWLST